MFGKRKRQKEIDLDKARRIWVGCFYHQYWKNGREYIGREEEGSAYLKDDCASQWIKDEFGGLSLYTIIDCLEEFLEYDKEHPKDIEPIREVLRNRHPDGIGDSNYNELKNKKNELLERISSQQKWFLKKREGIAEQINRDTIPTILRETGADFKLE